MVDKHHYSVAHILLNKLGIEVRGVAFKQEEQRLTSSSINKKVSKEPLGEDLTIHPLLGLSPYIVSGNSPTIKLLSKFLC